MALDPEFLHCYLQTPSLALHLDPRPTPPPRQLLKEEEGACSGGGAQRELMRWLHPLTFGAVNSAHKS